MNILVTGYKGFIGQNLVEGLENDHELSLFEWGDQLPEISQFDWVIHCGAISSTTEKDIDKVMTQNYDFSVELYNLCKNNAVNFQFSSSASVYGLNSEFTEVSPVDPRTPYAWSKYLTERYILNHLPKDSVAQCFRYFNVYGPGESHKGEQASPFTKFEKQAKELGYVKVFENSNVYLRDFIHVDQIVDIHKKFFSVQESGVWNAGTGKTMSFQEVAEQLNVPIKTIPMPENLKESYQTYTCADVTKLVECNAQNN